MSYKQNKIMREVLQMQSDGSDKYLINGIDQKLAVYFYRTAQEQFKILSPGDYKIVTELNNTYLTITNAIVSSTAETYQVCYDYIITSSAYTPIGDVDDIILKDKYNQLQADFQTIYEYIRKQGMFSDDTTLDVIFPQLDTGEVFVKTADGWKGFQIGDIDTNLKEFWKEFNTKTGETITNIKDEGTTQVKNVVDASADALTAVERQWKMYSIVTGANRFLSGNILDKRKEQALDREVDGKTLEERSNLILRRSYDGGKLEDRAMTQDLRIDLGEVKS